MSEDRHRLSEVPELLVALITICASSLLALLLFGAWQLWQLIP